MEKGQPAVGGEEWRFQRPWHLEPSGRGVERSGPPPPPPGAGTAPYKTRGRGVRGEIGGSDRSLVRFARVGQEGRVKIHGISGGVGGLEDS